MNYRVKPPSVAARWGGLLLALLVPPLATGVSQQTVPQDPDAVDRALPYTGGESRSYLLVVGSPPLRFQDPETPLLPEVSTRPPAAGPPTPSDKRARAGGQADLAAGSSAAKEDNASPKPVVAPPPKPGPVPILPDDGSSRVRPEDFLPFFQFPGARPGPSESTIGVPPSAPTPGQIPPSSATYQQE
jgi:hypothetical protein